MTPQIETGPSIRLEIERNLAASRRIALEAGILEAQGRILAILREHYEEVLCGNERPTKWLELLLDLSYHGVDALSLLFDLVGARTVRTIMIEELNKRSELTGSQVKVSISHPGPNNVSFMVIKFTSAIYPAT